MKVARYYRGARTTHLERLGAMRPGDFMFKKPMYDFAADQAPDGTDVRQVGLTDVLRAVWQRDYDVLEIVEPYAPSAMVDTVLISAVARISRRRQGSSTMLVCYAIENADLPGKFAADWHLPVMLTRFALRLTVGFGFKSMGRVCFGTMAASENYRRLLGSRALAGVRAPEVCLVEGLPSPRVTRSMATDPRDPVLIFLGTLDDRKGILQLLDAWPLIHDRLPAATLTILGKGKYESRVRDVADVSSSVELIVDPPRQVVWQKLGSATALCLLSQPSPQWTEQIGLPVLEALSVGLEVVASSETGIADWLRREGHRVLRPDCSPSELAQALVEILDAPRSRDEIVAALPAVDGRIEADAWLHRPVVALSSGSGTVDA
jgi:glycosyltransferase involved in cell wall biosynthesis